MEANFYYNNVKAWYKNGLTASADSLSNKWKVRRGSISVHESYFSSTSHWAWGEAKIDRYQTYFGFVGEAIAETFFLYAGVICEKNGYCRQAREDEL